VVEAEARLAALAVGCDPGLGLLHADLRSRDSLACDLMEPVRSAVDAFVFETLSSRVFR
jgi:CRISPR-associated protein Cas1